MIINPHLPSGHVIFCDDLRLEVSGKYTVVGAYNSEMLVFSNGPTLVPQLRILIFLRIALESMPLDIDIKILQRKSGSDEIVELGNNNVQLPAPDPAVFAAPIPDKDSIRFAEIQAQCALIPFQVETSSMIIVRAYIGDDEVRLGVLNVVLNEAPDETDSI